MLKKKYILIFLTCALLVLLLMGRSFLSNSAEIPDPGLVPLEEQYSDDELAIYEDVFNSCVRDINSAHPDTEKTILISTCLCAAKRVMRAYINSDDPAFKDDTYDASKSQCYEITVKYMS